MHNSAPEPVNSAGPFTRIQLDADYELGDVVRLICGQEYRVVVDDRQRDVGVVELRPRVRHVSKVRAQHPVVGGRQRTDVGAPEYVQRSVDRPVVRSIRRHLDDDGLIAGRRQVERVVDHAVRIHRRPVYELAEIGCEVETHAHGGSDVSCGGGVRRRRIEQRSPMTTVRVRRGVRRLTSVDNIDDGAVDAHRTTHANDRINSCHARLKTRHV